MKHAEPRELDLHGERARDARTHVVNFIRSLYLSAPGSSARIVTGLGLHSTASPVLHRLVRQMLESNTVPHVAAWSAASDGGSFLVQVAGSATAPPGRPAAEPASSAGGRQSDREWNNARQLEYARRRAERERAAAAEAAAEARRLDELRKEYGGKELPGWLCLPPPEVVEARAARARAEEADRIEYSKSRAETQHRE